MNAAAAVIADDATFPDHVSVYLTPAGVTALCYRCRTSVRSPASPLGYSVVKEWLGRHRHGA